MNLTHEKLVIRDAKREDAALLCQWWNSGEIMAHAGFPNGLGTTQEVVEKQSSVEYELEKDKYGL